MNVVCGIHRRWRETLAASVACAVFAGAAAGGSYTAADFDLESMIGCTYRVISESTGSEINYPVSPNPVASSSSGVGEVRFAMVNQTIDGFPANVRLQPTGAAAESAVYMYIDNAVGIIDFGNKLGPTGNLEHFTNGRTFIPGVLDMGAVLPDPRTNTWEGRWDTGEQWTGAYNATLTVVGKESITHPSGIFDALRLDFEDSRTKVGLSGNQWATEDHTGSMWLVEGMGLVRWSGQEHKVIYNAAWDGGQSPVYESWSDETLTYVKVVRDPSVVPSPTAFVAGAALLAGLTLRRRRTLSGVAG